MTAHHLYDQWETFMMRLSKGSGLTGLCSIRSCIKTDYGQLIRPFLTTSPTVFKNFLKEINHPLFKILVMKIFDMKELNGVSFLCYLIKA